MYEGESLVKISKLNLTAVWLKTYKDLKKKNYADQKGKKSYFLIVSTL
jgi:hypothetical protein